MTERFDLRMSAGALADLEALHHYVSETRSSVAADELLSALLAKAEGLENFPRRGATPIEAGSSASGEIRQTLAGPYRLVYRIIGEAVTVVLIADGRRDLQTLMNERLLSS